MDASQESRPALDGLLVQVKIMNVHPGRPTRVASRSVMVERGGGLLHEALKVERAAHRLAVVICAELEEVGWKLRGPQATKDPEAGDPTSGENSPL